MVPSIYWIRISINEICNEPEGNYEKSNFEYSKKDAIVDKYIGLLEDAIEIGVIFDRELMFKLVERNWYYLNYGSDELKHDKEVALAAVKSFPKLVLNIDNDIFVDKIIYETTVYYHTKHLINENSILIKDEKIAISI